jgi:hypothetical protein
VAKESPPPQDTPPPLRNDDFSNELFSDPLLSHQHSTSQFLQSLQSRFEPSFEARMVAHNVAEDWEDEDFKAQSFMAEYEIEQEELAQLWGAWKWEVLVNTMYKKKGKKVHPANVPLLGGVKPEGIVGAGSVSSEGLTVVPRGSRLTPDRLEKMQIGNGFLTKEEHQLFVDILFEFEGAIAFKDSEMGMLRDEIEPPIKIHTIPHEPWQQQNLRLPKAMQETAMAIVKDKLELGVLEHCQGPYRSRYFLVQKKSGSWRFINDVQPLNKVTIRESGMPPAVDEFSEDFAGYPITSAMDFYSGYYEIGLDPESRDLTAFMVPDVGLVRMTRLPQGWTNSVSCFQRIMGKVHWALIPDKCRPFVDDAGLKGPKDRYREEECAPGIRRFVKEHTVIFRQFMESTWKAGLTISGLKSVIGVPGITIVGFMCDEDGRRPVPKKVQRILDWPTPRSLRETRAFVGTAVYYRIFIAGFASITAPLFQLFKKGKVFKWTDECAAAMLQLKAALVKAPVLTVLDFSEGGLRMELGIDASTTVGWGAVLSQYKDDGKLHPARYESGVWSDPERKYDALKLECRGLIKALKKLRFWLFGRYFTVVTDSQTLVWLLNQPPNDLPNAMMTRWLAYARLFDFDVRHVRGSQNGAADGLSRRGKGEDDETDSDPDDFFDSCLYNITVGSFPHHLYNRYRVNRVAFDPTLYEGDDVILGKYLTTLQRPEGMSTEDYAQLRRKSRNFLVRDGSLFKRSRRGRIPPRLVVGLAKRRREIMEEIHGLGHPGQKATYDQISRRYQWRGMYQDVVEWVKTCDECQRRGKRRFEEPLHPTWSVTVWDKVGLDVIYMPWEGEGGDGYLVLARDDLSGYVEGRPMDKVTSLNVAKFLQEDVVCRHGVPRKIVLDGGSENLGFTRDLMRQYGMHGIAIAPYHPQSNGLIERGHQTIVNAIAKYRNSDASRNANPRNPPIGRGWSRYLSLAMWADRITVRRTTGYSAFELVYGRECLLPIQLAVNSWNLVDWDVVKDDESLILARMEQLDERKLMEAEAARNLQRSRIQNKAYFDSIRRIRPPSQALKKGDLVVAARFPKLLLGERLSREDKLDDRWEGPYRIRDEVEDSTYYLLEELSGVPLKRKFAGNQLKKYFVRKGDVLGRVDGEGEVQESVE